MSASSSQRLSRASGNVRAKHDTRLPLEERGSVANKARRNEARRFAIFPLVCCIVLTVAAFPRPASSSTAVKEGNEVFLKSSYLEIGINEFGSLGTTGSPAPEHGFNGDAGANTGWTGIGLTSDPEADGYSVSGLYSPDFVGDFIMGGKKAEGWSLKYSIDDADYLVSNLYPTNDTTATDVSAMISTSGASPRLFATWIGTEVEGNVKVSSVISTSDVFSRMRGTVTLQNVGVHTLSNVSYMRSINPDMEAPWNNETETRNYVASNPGRLSYTANLCLAVATGITEQEFTAIGVGAVHPNCRVSQTLSNSTDPDDAWIDDSWQAFNAPNPVVADEYLKLTHRFDTLLPGTSVTFSWFYIPNDVYMIENDASEETAYRIIQPSFILSGSNAVVAAEYRGYSPAGMVEFFLVSGSEVARVGQAFASRVGSSTIFATEIDVSFRSPGDYVLSMSTAPGWGSPLSAEKMVTIKSPSLSFALTMEPSQGTTATEPYQLIGYGPSRAEVGYTTKVSFYIATSYKLELVDVHTGYSYGLALQPAWFEEQQWGFLVAVSDYGGGSVSVASQLVVLASPSPSPTATPSPSPSPSTSSSQTPSSTHTPSQSATPTHTSSATLTPSQSSTHSTTSTQTPSSTATSSQTPSSTATSSRTSSSTATSSQTSSPTPTSSQTSSSSATSSPTPSPSATHSPSQTPSHTPSHSPSATHSSSATHSASSTHSSTATPTQSATHTPSSTPSSTHTQTPTPTATPTRQSPIRRAVRIEGVSYAALISDPVQKDAFIAALRQDVANLSPGLVSDDVVVHRILPGPSPGSVIVDYLAAVRSGEAETLDTAIEAGEDGAWLSNVQAALPATMCEGGTCALQSEPTQLPDESSKGVSMPIVLSVAGAVVTMGVVLAVGYRKFFSGGKSKSGGSGGRPTATSGSRARSSGSASASGSSSAADEGKFSSVAVSADHVKPVDVMSPGRQGNAAYEGTPEWGSRVKPEE